MTGIRAIWVCSTIDLSCRTPNKSLSKTINSDWSRRSRWSCTCSISWVRSIRTTTAVLLPKSLKTAVSSSLTLMTKSKLLSLNGAITEVYKVISRITIKSMNLISSLVRHISCAGLMSNQTAYSSSLNQILETVTQLTTTATKTKLTSCFSSE